MQNKLNIFVIMPFDSEFDSVYQELIKKPLEDRGYTVNRADDVSSDQNIIKLIVQNIKDADLIIADLTTQNANVYYELGIAHTFFKRTIQITQSIDDVPFDLRPYNVILYSVHFMVASQLTERILDILERERGDEYKFSSPVSDTLGREVEIISTIPPLSSLDNNGEEMSNDDGEAISDDGDMGILDAIVAAEDSTDEIKEIALEIAKQFTTLSGKAQNHTGKINQLNSNPEQKGLNSKRLQIARQFAKDLNEFSDGIKETTPRLTKSWANLDQGLGYFISNSEIKRPDELQAVHTFIENMRDLQNGVNKNSNMFKNFRESQMGVRGLSRATDRALNNSDKTLGKLSDEFKLGDSVLTRLINLADDMIDRYNANMLNNGDDVYLTPSASSVARKSLNTCAAASLP